MNNNLIVAYLALLLLFMSGCGSAEHLEGGYHGMITSVSYGDNKVYIVGTIHAGSDVFFPLHSSVEEAIRRADIFAMERLDGLINDTSDSARAAITHNNVFVFDVIEAYGGLSTDEVRQFEETIRKYSSWQDRFILTFTTRDLVAPEMNFLFDSDIFTQPDIDIYLLLTAQRLGLPLKGLRTFEQELSIFAEMPVDVIIDFVRNFPVPEEIEADWELIVDFFSSRPTLDCVNTFIPEIIRAFEMLPYGTGSPKEIWFSETLVRYRSRYFTQAIEDLLVSTEEPTTFFVAIGLAHVNLTVIDHFENQGFEVNRIYRGLTS